METVAEDSGRRVFVGPVPGDMTDAELDEWADTAATELQRLLGALRGDGNSTSEG